MEDHELADQRQQNARSEYSAIAEYHDSQVKIRFTIAGLYVAAIGFIASAVLSKDATWIARSVGSFLACWFAICLWILELRSRALYKNIVHRGIEIEHRIWGLRGAQWYDGFFSRQYKEPPKDERETDVPKPVLDRPKIAWMKEPLSENISRFISHSWGLDLLYVGTLIFWYILLLFSLFNVSCVYSGLFIHHLLAIACK